MVFAVVIGLAAWLFVSQATIGVAMIAMACLIGILARMAQAENFHGEIKKLLEKAPEANS